MQIIVIEDIETKAAKVIDVIRQYIDHPSVIHVRSYHSAIMEFKSKEFDLAIVDMSIPNFEEDNIADPDALSLGGRDLILHALLLGVKCKFVVVSGYKRFPFDSGDLDLSDICQELNRRCNGNFLGYVEYVEGSNKTTENLRSFLIPLNS